MRHRYTDLTLRIGLAFSFLYPAIDAWSDPFTWLGYIPKFVADLWPFSNFSLLHSFGALEIVLALWILSGKRIAYPALLAGLILVFIVVTNTTQFDTLFRDVTIALLAFALAWLHWPKNREVVA